MKIAFYAPMKPPDHPNPSGDRLMANNLIDALRAGGHEVDLVSHFRPRDADGDPDRQERFRHVGAWHAKKIIQSLSNAPPDVWLTYHLYYKTPDWLGPAVTKALEIPYCVAEASVAPKRATGPWAQSHLQVTRALRQADLVVFPNKVDEAYVLPVLRPNAKTLRLPPFIKTDDLLNRESCRIEVAKRYGLAIDKPWLLTVAMMREGDKSASYEILSRICSELPDIPHEHLIVGDGVQRGEIEHAFLALNTTFVGRLDGRDLHQVYAASDVFVWPGVNEAWGMVYLEAQSHALPVIAGRSGGIENVVSDGETGYLVDLENDEAFIRALALLLRDEKRRETMGSAGRQTVLNRHSFVKAAERLNSAFQKVGA